ncbi:MAG: hypothetical protein H6711_16745 [Myxococcales bacterium]|nr:hypothetical protein [Myxococcales bacterium]
MNFFGHALIAARGPTSPARVLGAMLPDLCGMARLRSAGVDDPELAAGVALHHRTDDVFHRAPTFLALQGALGGALEDAGIAHYSAIAAAHVGVEMLLDGWLFDQLGSPPIVDDALALAAPAPRWRQADGDARWRELLARLRAAALPPRYRDPAFVGERLPVILGRYRRLAVDDAGAAAILAWAPQAAAMVRDRAAALVAEVDHGLER